MHALEEAVVGWQRGPSKGQKEQPDWFHPLRSLVQAGIPMVSHPFPAHSVSGHNEGMQQPS